MKSSRKIEDLLLYKIEPSKISHIEDKLKSQFNDNLPGIVSLALVFCLFINFDFTGVIKRTVQGVAIVAIFSTLIFGAKDFGMSVGNAIISQDNFIWKKWDEATGLAENGFSVSEKKFKENFKKNVNKDESSWSIQGVLGDLSSDFVSFLIWLFSQIGIIATKISFTLVFYVTLLTIPVIALVNILPMTSRALDGALVSIIWIAVSPIIFALFLEILSLIVSDHVDIESFSFVTKGIMGLLFVIYLIKSLSMARAIVKEGSMGSIVGDVSQSMGMAVAMSGVSLLKNNAMRFGKKGLSFGGERLFLGNEKKSSLTRMSVAKIDQGKDLLAKKSESILDKYAPTSEELLKNKRPKLKKRERVVVLASTLASPIQTIKMSKAKREVAFENLKQGRGDQVITSNLVKDEKSIPERKVSKIEKGKVKRVVQKREMPRKYHYGRDGKVVEGENPDGKTYTRGKKLGEQKPKNRRRERTKFTEKTSYKRNAKESFKFNEQYWKTIDEKHKESIKKKYGIVGDRPEEGKTYYPVSKNREITQ